MRFPADVSRLAARQFASRLPELLDADSYEWSVPLHPPQAATAANDFDKVQDFIRTWQGWTDPGSITTKSKHWHRAGLGIQQVPTRISTSTPAEFAALAGSTEDFKALQEKLVLLGSANTERALEVIQLWRNLTPQECAWVPQVVDWFRVNPSSGLRPRSVPVAGVHGKWLEHHARLVRHLLGVEDLGLVSGDHLIRLRILDRSLGTGLIDVSTPLAEASALWPAGGPSSGPQIALIVENKETFLNLTNAWPSTVAVWGAGYAVGMLDRLPWLHRCHRLVYWGDLDAEGFAILHRLRHHFPTVESVLMSPADVDRWAHLGVPDPGNYATDLPLLSSEESDARRALLMHGKIRIEQERIPWDAALEALDERLR
ncbi:MAG: DUF2220 family protein [Corynebacterium flavescens]|uniref:Wadjet anti-phage system protein JetD domain-containing protein n=1 Tax=Corynebacterium flavescens TaxID=28028 RepID=UPI002649ED4D|nr:Wadjet anti-phage system protein JetD domain-containing protein [Corynebacterium flavescens]MDN6100566.1 DUF2220 family protein [Corynebacterium flavescens]